MIGFTDCKPGVFFVSQTEWIMSVLNFYACINQRSHSGGKKRKKGKEGRGREGKIYNVG